MKLSTRVNLLLYALILVAFVSLLPPLRSYLETRAPLEEVERDLENILGLMQFDFLVTRQTIEYVDIALVAEDAEELEEEIEELEEMQTVARTVLDRLSSASQVESDPELQELESVAMLEDAYDRLGQAGDAILELAQQGEVEKALTRIGEPTSIRRQVVAPTIDRAVSRETQATERGLDRLLATSGRFAFLPIFKVEDAVSRLRRDTEEAIDAATFAQSLERLVGEYIDVAFLDDPPAQLYVVRGQADQALQSWQGDIESGEVDRPALRRQVEEIAARYQELLLLGDRFLELAAQEDREVALEFFEDDFEPAADESLAELVDTAYDAHVAAARASLENSEALFARAGLLVILLATAVLALAVVVPFLMSRWIVRPVVELSRVTRIWGEGDLSPRNALDSGGEIGELATGLNRMADGLVQAREQLQRQARLAALGELAGSVGHEIRNPLAIIKNSSFFLRSFATGTDDKIRRHLAIIARQIGRADRIITELLDYARDPKVESKIFAACEACENALELVEIPESVRVEKALDDTVKVEADPGQIERCLANLASNAVQAMPDGGHLRLECRSRDGEVVIAVTDTGVGITEEARETVFEPLYTTRSKGIGLGLPIAKRYARLNHGRLECESEPGRGTTFRLILPATEPAGD